MSVAALRDIIIQLSPAIFDLSVYEIYLGYSFNCLEYNCFFAFLKEALDCVCRYVEDLTCM